MRYVEEFHPVEAVQWLTRSVADLSQRRRGFDRRPPHVRCVVDEVALGQVLFRAPCFPLSTIPPMLHTYLDLHVTLTRAKKS